MSNNNLVINNFEFAKKTQSLSGAMGLQHMPRLAEWLESLGALQDEMDASKELVTYELIGSTDSAEQQLLQLNVQFSAELVCQRCFELMNVSHDLSFEYLVTDMSEEEIMSAEVDLEESYDLITKDPVMDLRAMIVDEVIAATPYAPMHEPVCKASKLDAGEKPNPFAVLQSLKKN